MRKLPKFLEHGCYCEQKIAYNYLFTYGHINECSLDFILNMFNDEFYTSKLKRYDISAIKKCISKNYDKYIKNPFIASNYNDIATQLPL